MMLNKCFKKSIQNITRDEDDLGLIAQWTEKVEPLLVDTDEDGYKGIKYNKVSILNTAAIQELYYEQKEINKNLEDRISRLEQQYNELINHGNTDK